MKLIIFAGFLLLCQAAFAGEAKIIALRGSASVKDADADKWSSAVNGSKIITGQKIKTKARSRITLKLDDGSRMEVYPNSHVDLRNLNAKTPVLKVIAGRIRAWVSKNVSREKFEVHTPVAVCSVRGTDFTVDVAESGSMSLDVSEGLVGVKKADGQGDEVFVGAGEKLFVDQDIPPDESRKINSEADKTDARREVGLEMSKEEVQSAAAEELKLAEYQEGKSMVDVYGMRVRLEEYVVRPAADQFKLVVLNERDSRFDYFYYKGTFNKNLPADLSSVLKELDGKLGSTAPEYYLTSYEKAFSNTSDYVKDTGSGGHLVKIDYNMDGTFTVTDNGDNTNTKTVNSYDATNGAYDPITDLFDTTKTSAQDAYILDPVSDEYKLFIAGQTYWSARYNSYEHIINGVKKQWYLPSNASVNVLAADLDGHFLYPATDSNGDTIYGEWGVSSAESSYPGTDTMHNRLKINYLDGTYEQYDNYIISDEGKLANASDFGNITTGSQYKETLLKWNYEQVITATEFGNRKIDLVVEPKILIKSGLIK